MKIKMTTSMAGVAFALSPGDETEQFGDAEAIRLIEAGYAVPVAEDVTEKAVRRPVKEKRG
ncbi:hypothetical protein VQ042_01285 [Aurantimonas sp. A2-1-M11]|uniref:hypothetical protein n=1 Tax=Aurantimonas sp. A2-1-M11 TaxID=3113712 RepID=UPI002F925F61